MCRKKMTTGKVFPKLATSLQHLHVQGKSPQKREELPGTEVSTAVFIFSFNMDKNSSGRGNCGDHTVADPKDHTNVFCLLSCPGIFPQLLLPQLLSIKLALLHLSMVQTSFSFALVDLPV